MADPDKLDTKKIESDKVEPDKLEPDLVDLAPIDPDLEKRLHLAREESAKLIRASRELALQTEDIMKRYSHADAESDEQANKTSKKN